MEKIAFLVGHSYKSMGAEAYTGESEYEFNIKVCSYIKEKLNNENFMFFTKDKDYVNKIKLFDPDLIVELHFNAFEKKAYGCEAIALKTSPESIYEAELMLELFNKRFDIKSREVLELHGGFQRGFRNLEELKGFKMFLFEPCFANFETEDSQKIIGDWRNYAEFLIEYITLNIGIKPKKNENNILSRMIEMIQSWF